MRKTFIKKSIDDLVKSVELKYGKKCELMTLNLKTCITGEGEMFAHAEAIVNLEGDDQSYKVEKDYDL